MKYAPFPKILICICLISGLLISASVTTSRQDTAEKDNIEKILGADISFLPQLEDEGLKFYVNGVQKDAIQILKEHGFNYIRLRIFVDPAADSGYSKKGYCGLEQTKQMAKRIRAANMKFLLDFHYSDNWADGGKQYTPAAWKNLAFPELVTQVHDYSKQVITELQQQGTPPDMVQIGNEISHGMLWPDGTASDNMAAFAQLISTGYDAVKEIFPDAKVIVHISNGYDNNLFRWIFDGLTLNNAKFDVIGMSLYPSVTNWAAYNSQCLANMNDMVSRYNKEVMIVEVGMPWDSPDECWSFLTDIISKTKTVTGNKALGVSYWEPEAYNNWSGYTLGAFDNTGKPTHALDAFK